MTPLLAVARGLKSILWDLTYAVHTSRLDLDRNHDPLGRPFLHQGSPGRQFA
jgi:hypothetical protein